MHDERLDTEPRGLSPYVLKSLLLHGVLFALIAVLLFAEQDRVSRQEDIVIKDVRAQERRQEEEERQAREAAVTDLLSEQLRAEMDSLIAQELDEEHEQALSQMTAEDVERLMDEAESERSLEDLLDQEFYELSDELRGRSLEEMRANLREMKQDLLLNQVRSFIRRYVAPEIKSRIEARLRDDVGNRMQAEAAGRLRAEKSARLNAVNEDLQKAIRELGGIKRQQDGAATSAERRRLADAEKAQGEVRQKQAANAADIDAVLEKAAQASPELASEAESLRARPEGKRVAAAVEEAATAVKAAKVADDARAAAPEVQRPEAEKAAAEKRAEAAERGRDAGARMAERIKELQEFSKQLVAQSRAGAADSVQKQIVDEALVDIKEAVRKKVTEEVAATAIPLAADRIMEALAKDLEKRKLGNDKFREFLKKDIKQALELEMAGHQPDPAQALLRTEDRFDLRDEEALEKARKEVSEIAKKLEELAATEESLRDEADKKTAEEAARRQEALTGDIGDARKRAQAALRKAGRATLQRGKEVGTSARDIANAKTEDKSTEAAAALKREQVPDAKDLMNEVAEELKKSAGSLRGVEEGLADEIAKLKRPPRPAVDLTKALGEQEAKKAVEDAEKAAGKAIEERTQPAVAYAAGSVDVRGVLSTAEDAQELARMDALEEKLDQVAENLAEGRGLGEDPGIGMPGPGRGLGLGGAGGSDGIIWGVQNRRSMSRFNREAYEKFVEDMRDRLNPDNYYADTGSTEEGIASVARTGPNEVAALVFVEELPRSETPADAEERRVPTPTFPFKAFGAAPMMEKRVTIDGDLSDWGKLGHPLKMKYCGNSLEPIEDGPELYVRWSPDGLYVGYTLKDPSGIQPCKDHPWSGDCLEMMTDTANSRLPDAYKNLHAQKFCFTPFGCRGSDAVTVWEMGRGLRGMGMARDYPDLKGIKGRSAKKLLPGGYSVECFLSRRALVDPRLVPGKYLAVNFSVNTEYSGGKPGTQWSASQQLQTWHKPDTWGDLLLLGSDAKLRFIGARLDSEDEVRGIVPNEPIGVQVHDADMNINTLKVDRIAAEVSVKERGAALFVVLQETGVNTGIFRASINTQPYFLPARENTLNVRGGDTIRLNYTDARAEYGEKNRKVTAGLPVGWPVMKLGGR